MDLLSQRNRALVESFLDPDTRSLLDREADTEWNTKHRKLSRAVGSVVSRIGVRANPSSVSPLFQLDDYSLVKFVPLDIKDEESIADLLLTIDNSIQYGEDLEVKDRYPEEVNDRQPERHLQKLQFVLFADGRRPARW